MKKNIENMLLIKKILKLIYYLLIMILVMVSFHILKNYGIYLLLLRLLRIIMPFIIGFIIAWILKPILDKLTLLKIPKVIGSILIYVVIFALIVFLFKIIIPDLNNEINNVSIIIKENYTKFNSFLLKIVKKPCHVSNINHFLMGYAKSYLPKLILVTRNCFNYILYLLVGLVIGLYTLINYDYLNDFFINLIPRSKKDFYHNLINRVSSSARSCVNGTIIVAFLVFLTSFLAFLIIRIPHPLIYSMLCGITDVIPYIGPYIGGIPVLIVAFGISNKLGYITLIIVILIQMLENYVYGPLIMSHQSKLNPLLIIFGLLLFGNLFGIIGLVIATPFMSIIRVVIIEYKNYFK